MRGVDKAAEKRVEQKHSEETPKKMPELLRGVEKAAEKRKEQKLEQESTTSSSSSASDVDSYTTRRNKFAKHGRRNAGLGALA